MTSLLKIDGGFPCRVAVTRLEQPMFRLNADTKAERRDMHLFVAPFLIISTIEDCSGESPSPIGSSGPLSAAGDAWMVSCAT